MIECVVASPEQTKIYKNLRSVTLPGFKGQMQVLGSHAETFVLLREGQVVLEQAKQRKSFRLKGGFSHIRDDRVVIVL
jgi:F0F1-type ATP synthase epsilon subunit